MSNAHVHPVLQAAMACATPPPSPLDAWVFRAAALANASHNPRFQRHLLGVEALVDALVLIRDGEKMTGGEAAEHARAALAKFTGA